MNNNILVSNPENPVLRSVLTGAVAAAVASSTVNMRKVRNDEISKTEALKDTVKRTSQGAIASGAAVATAGYLSQKGGLLKAMATLSVGMAGIYAIEILDDKLENKYKTQCCKNEETLEEE